MMVLERVSCFVTWPNHATVLTVCCAYPSLISLMVSVDVMHHERIEKTVCKTVYKFSVQCHQRERGMAYIIIHMWPILFMDVLLTW